MDFPILAIDYGRKHIGVAVSDSKGIVSSPLPVIHLTKIRGLDGVIEDISAICHEYRVKTLLFGMPQAFEEGHLKTQKVVQKFIRKVAEKIQLPYKTTDESFSTSTAQNMLLSTGHNTKGSRGKIDSASAALFLQEYLDNLSE